MRSQFFAVVSHDVKTPLNSIVGFINLLSQTELTSSQNEYLEIIKSSSSHLITLINDILDLTKIEHGALELNVALLDPRELIQNCVHTFIPISKEKNVTLICDISEDVPEGIHSDYVRLKQIIINLMGNAMKFTHDGNVKLTCVKEGEFLRFNITDTGVGIDKTVQQYIFTPFAQGHASVTQKYGGSGLGLAITKQLVEKFGGMIKLESEPGNGSTFIFTIPIDTKVEPLPPLNDEEDLENES